MRCAPATRTWPTYRPARRSGRSRCSTSNGTAGRPHGAVSPHRTLYAYLIKCQTFGMLSSDFPRFRPTALLVVALIAPGVPARAACDFPTVKQQIDNVL